MPRFVFSLCILSMAFPFVARAESADKNKKDYVATDPAQADADYAFQGEYMGDLLAGPHAGRAGLQVIALGDGTFDAVFYPGGLPGNGWTRERNLKLSGAKKENRLTLAGDDISAKIRGLDAKLFNAAGDAIGQLKKVTRISPTLGAPPAAGAKVLFDGTSTEHFTKGKLTPEGHLLAGPLTAEPVGDFRTHIEFRLPYKPHAAGKGAATAAFTFKSGTRCRCSTRSDSKEPPTNAAGCIDSVNRT